MIRLDTICKSYGGTQILEDVSFTLREGTVTTLTGRNGCGKSTLLKITAGLVKKDSGTIIFDRKPRIAYVPEKLPSSSMTPLVYLRYMAGIDGRKGRAETEKEIRKMAEEFFIDRMLDTPMNRLSKGSLQKVGVVSALLSEPDLLLLDEPLSGQDGDSQEVFIEKIKELRDRGAIVLLSAHEQMLIDRLSDRVYTITDRHLVEADKAAKRTYRIILEEGEPIFDVLETLLAAKITSLQKEGRRICRVEPEN